jgi:phosphatidylserine/phosphatidylglycerophosphate/cardiolipin synthase-like enzyme
MVDWSLRQFLQAHGIQLEPGLRSLNVPSLRCVRWFETGGSPAMQPVRAGNAVTWLIDGPQTFKSMSEALQTANSAGHYIYLLGWWLIDALNIVQDDPRSTSRAIFASASQQGVQVRAMLWDQWGSQNSDEVEHINALPHGAAILDNRTLNYGSHHQKILVVKGTEGLIAFCGGIDINSDRVSWGSGSNGFPLHDVHCRIQGPAAHDLLRIFLERWQDHPGHSDLDRKKGSLLGLVEAAPLLTGTLFVQIGRTYGNGKRHAGLGGGYTFAPNGEQTAKRMILRGISEARRFIYMEEQYLVDMEASQALQAALMNIQHLTILIPDCSLMSVPQTCFRRQQFIAPLKRVGGDKVRVFILSPSGAFHTYVHSKIYIVDDQFAIIGSANCNRRGWTHDSEAVAGILDTASGEFARQLRIALWAEHLNIDKTDGRLADGAVGADLWMSLPAGSTRIAQYDQNAGIERIHTDKDWDNFVDPDGS